VSRFRDRTASRPAYILALATTLLLPIPAPAQDQAPRDPRWLPLINQQIAPQPELGAPQPRRGKRSMQLSLQVDPKQLPRMLSKPLSTACALERFNQGENDRYYIRLTDAAGKPLRLGIAGAKVGNLHDPGRQSLATHLYLFDKDWTSECKVYAMQAP